MGFFNAGEKSRRRKVMRKTSLESLGVSGSQLRNLGLIVVLLRRSIRAASLVSFALTLAVASNVVYGADALVGRWLTTRSSDAGGMSYKGSLSYEIFPNGSYKYSTLLQSSTIGCHSKYETGTVSVKGMEIVFLPTSGTKGDCSERGTALPKEDLGPRNYTFRLARDSYSGKQQLCLKGDKGESCYSRDIPSK
jgi:hypothetical protein